MPSIHENLKVLGSNHEILTVQQLERAGISDHSVTRLVRCDELIRVDRGLYRLLDAPVSRDHEIICVAATSPSSVMVLLSALVRTRVSDLFEIGVETHQLGGQNVKITNPARTVADCFKHRNKLGLEVCIEAAKEAVRGKKATVSDMAEMAKQLRVLSVMQPYLEVI